ncbi:flagellar hook-basal body complex protein FliE [Planctomycetota bacterium]
MADAIGPQQPLPIEPGKIPGQAAKPAEPGEFQGKSFKEIFSEQIKAVNELQRMADAKQEDLALGRTDDIADVLDAVEKADLAFKTLMQVRNKLVDAYNEISRMRI